MRRPFAALSKRCLCGQMTQEYSSGWATRSLPSSAILKPEDALARAWRCCPCSAFTLPCLPEPALSSCMCSICLQKLPSLGSVCCMSDLLIAHHRGTWVADLWQMLKLPVADWWALAAACSDAGGRFTTSQGPCQPGHCNGGRGPPSWRLRTLPVGSTCLSLASVCVLFQAHNCTLHVKVKLQTNIVLGSSCHTTKAASHEPHTASFVLAHLLQQICLVSMAAAQAQQWDSSILHQTIVHSAL